MGRRKRGRVPPKCTCEGGVCVCVFIKLLIMFALKNSYVTMATPETNWLCPLKPFLLLQLIGILKDDYHASLN